MAAYVCYNSVITYMMFMFPYECTIICEGQTFLSVEWLKVLSFGEPVIRFAN